MKPSHYRNASAIYVLKNGHGFLMDCAEGSYTQLWDHFNCKKKVDEIIRRTNFVFITHIHGDHQLGILKIMYERDQLLDDYDENDKLYVITPTLMFSWV